MKKVKFKCPECDEYVEEYFSEKDLNETDQLVCLECWHGGGNAGDINEDWD